MLSPVNTRCPPAGDSPGPAEGSHHPVSTKQHRTGLPRPPLPPQRGRAAPQGRRIPAETAPLAPTAALGQPRRGAGGRGSGRAAAIAPRLCASERAGGGARRGSGRPGGRQLARRAAGPLRRRRQAACTSPRQLGAAHRRRRRRVGAGGHADVGGKLSNNNSDAGRCVGVSSAPARPAGLLLFMWGGTKMAGVEAARRT